MKQLFLIAVLLLAPSAVAAATQSYSSPGTYSFTVPSYGTLTVQVWGAGGGGGAAGSTNSGAAGGSSSFSSVVSGGGAGGGYSYGGADGAGGAGGTASGGDVNTSGQGGDVSAQGNGGSSPSGGAGGAHAPGDFSAGSGGSAPGGGGGGGRGLNNWAGGGGGGAYASKTYSSGQLTPGNTVSVVVGSGGAGGQYASMSGGSGAAGSVVITYTLPSSSRNITVNSAVSVKGDVTVTANLTKGSGTFMIDDPSDPANKLLYHSFVESPDALNEYAGTAVIGKDGSVVVKLPSYFEALNVDYQYFVRALDIPMPDLHVAKEVDGNAFTIGGGKAGGEVSWMVTGIRHDPYILAHPIVPEVEKGPGQLAEKGEYLFPGYRSACSNLASCWWQALWRLF